MESKELTIVIVTLKSEKKNVGKFGKDLKFANVIFKEGHYAYSDQDGIIIRHKEID